MTATRKPRPSALVQDLRNERKVPTPSETKRYLSGVGEMPGMTSEDLAVLEASVQVVNLELADVLTNALAALKRAALDPSRITLRTVDGMKVTANLPVAYVVDGRTSHVNLTVALEGRVGAALAPFAQRVARKDA